MARAKQAKTKKKAPKKSAARKQAPRAGDAIALLRADHKLVSELFAQFESTRSDAKKQQLAERICMELTIHAMVEEEIFYPAVEQALNDDELVPEARVEHESLKMLISQVEGGEPGDPMWEARVKVMGEYVKHHVKEEQNEMFPKVKNNRKLDLVELGEQIMARKEELKAELGQG